MRGGVVTVAPALSNAALVRETAISVLINCVMTAAFYFLVFHGVEPVPIWGLGNFAFDFAPQTFMIALMGTLVPGLIAAHAMKPDGPTRTQIARRAFLFALIAVAVGILASSALLWVSGLDLMPFRAGMIIKLVYGASLAAIVTPTFLRSQLR